MRSNGGGFDALKRHLLEAEKAFESIEGELGTAIIDASDPASVETAIAHMEQTIDERITAYRGNSLVAQIGADLKERYALAIRQRAEGLLGAVGHSYCVSDVEVNERNEESMNGASSNGKDEQRYLVLNYFYDFNESRCADEQWSEHAAADLQRQGHDIAHGDVARAITYLSDKGLLRVTKRQGYISGEETVVRAGITARGIDAIERPNEFRGVLSPQVINYIVHGSMNVAHGDQQVIGRDNSGAIAQGNAKVEQRNEGPALPADELRNEFAHHPEALGAIDQLDAELRTDTPRVSVVAGTIETIKNVANIAEIGKTFSMWLADPAVQHQLSVIASRTFGA